MQLTATSTTEIPWPTKVDPNLPPRSLSMRLDMPIWDSSLPVEVERLDNQLEQLFSFDGIRWSGDFDRGKLHDYVSGWNKRFDDLEALRGAILLHAPNRGGDLTHVVEFAKAQLPVLEAATAPKATRKELEAADRALIMTHNEMSALRWGVPSDVRDARWISTNDIAKSRVGQFDTDGDSRIDGEEFELKRTAVEMVFGDPRAFEQTFSGLRMFELADRQGAADGRTTVQELDAVLRTYDSNGDGWLSKPDFDRFEDQLDAFVRTQKVAGSRA